MTGRVNVRVVVTVVVSPAPMKCYTSFGEMHFMTIQLCLLGCTRSNEDEVRSKLINIKEWSMESLLNFNGSEFYRIE